MQKLKTPHGPTLHSVSLRPQTHMREINICEYSPSHLLPFSVREGGNKAFASGVKAN